MKKTKNKIMTVAAVAGFIIYLLINSFTNGEKFDLGKETLSADTEGRSSKEATKKIFDQIELNPNIVKNSR
ncbi:hypothetical protein SAMN05192566_1531 [Methylophilus rhizosphaerae]|uniref:Uncharacterized protein n=1 Tax=Methylophilus rhizosphaerae TaxID=492660 RepID=A0A1G9CMD8_9PROT|nr:hypothetical protein [Methylophilus rhizosphaerae]SDK52778.1 hypothetical protein SAMN05192566_1531 [Methylophilus rhizosphaerae]